MEIQRYGTWGAIVTLVPKRKPKYGVGQVVSVRTFRAKDNAWKHGWQFAKVNEVVRDGYHLIGWAATLKGSELRPLTKREAGQ